MKQTVNTPSGYRPAHFDQATQEKIHKHLSDPNDVITEQDIMNIKTDESILAPSDEVEMTSPASDEEINDEDGNNSNSIDNASVNILDA